MCGIIGTIGGELYPNMVQAIKHRGKKQYSFVQNEIKVHFHHLPILDEANGTQPKQLGNWTLFFNGEIYNWKELAKKYDVKISEKCDTLIILPLIQQLGVKKAVQEFNGMFSMFVYNSETGEKYLIRDRYGIKPMYYTRIGNDIYFSSELKAFRYHPKFKPEMDFKALAEYLKYQLILSDRTLYKGVRLLPPATIFNVHNGTYERYWSPKFEPNTKLEFFEARDEVRRLMIQAVERQLQSDVPIVSFLSGGIDSNIIKLIAGDRIKRTYTAGFSDGRSEHELVPKSNVLMFNSDSIKYYLQRTVESLEDLRCGPSYTNYALYDIVKKEGYNVCLQGTGGDELFGGYNHRYNMRTDYRSIINRNKYFEDESLEQFGTTIYKRYDFDFNYFLHGLLLVGDKLSMAHTIEDRVPFLDNDLVDFAMTIPASMKVDKWILKSAFMNDLPNNIMNNSKWGFTSPEHIWFEKNKEWINKELNYVWQFVPPPSQPMNTALTWSLLSLEYWIRKYIVNE